MTKNEFLAELRKNLSSLSSEDIESSLEYYAEMIDDRIEDGMDEESAVATFPTPEKAASDVLSEMPISKLVKARIKPKRTLRAWEIMLLVLGAPLWLSLILAAVAVVFAVYVSLWSVVVSFWAVGISIFASSLACLASSLALFFVAWNTGAGIFLFGAGVLLAGLGMFGVWGCKAITYAMCKLGKLILKGIKNCFIKKEAVK